MPSNEKVATMGRWSWSVEPDATAIAATRHHVVEVVHTCCASHAGIDTDALALATSELVTNAVRHGEPPIEVCVDTDADTYARVEVTDAGSDVPIIREQGGFGGHGLPIVEAMSSRSGWERADPGKVVWFEIPTARGAAA